GTALTTNFAGGSIGTAALGGIATTYYQHHIGHSFATGPLAQLNLPAAVQAPITDQIGGAAAVAAQLPPPVARVITAQASHAFVASFHVAMVCGIGIALFAAIVIQLLLRKPELAGSQHSPAKIPADHDRSG